MKSYEPRDKTLTAAASWRWSGKRILCSAHSWAGLSLR
jgi:hypothetical protein